MAVVMVLEAIEQRFEITIPDDAITGEAFASVGSLARFIRDAKDHQSPGPSSGLSNR